MGESDKIKKKDILEKMLMELTWMNSQIGDVKSMLNEIVKRIQEVKDKEDKDAEEFKKMIIKTKKSELKK